MNNAKLSKVIDSMRLPLIFLVIIAHLIPFTSHSVTFGSTVNDAYILVSEMFSHHIAKLSVRCYFLVSGFYFFNKYSGALKSFFVKQYKSRAKTLLIPYVIWNILVVLAVLAKNSVFHHFGLQYDEIYSFVKNSSLYDIFWAGPANFPFWFIRDLMCMILFSPVIFYFIRYFKIYGIIFLGAIYLLNLENNIPGFSLSAIFFFTLGAYFSLEKKDLLDAFDKIKIPALLIMVVFLFESLVRNGSPHHEYFVRIFILSGVISIFNFFAYLNDNYVFMNKLTGYSSLSFFIYAIHEMYIINWLKGFFYGLPMFNFGWYRLVVYFVIPFLCLGICTLIYYSLIRIAPKALAFSLGGRLPNYKKYEVPTKALASKEKELDFKEQQ